MKRSVLIGLIIGFTGLMACNEAKDETPQNCIHCIGCFSDWDVCKETYRPTEANPMTWEEYSEYMVTNPSGATWYCTRAN